MVNPRNALSAPPGVNGEFIKAGVKSPENVAKVALPHAGRIENPWSLSSMQSLRRISAITGLAVALAAAAPLPAAAATPPPDAPAAGATYADLADLADSAPLVLKAQIRKLSRVEDERAPGLRPGWGRYYVEARTRALLTGQAPRGEALAYLVDLPLDAKGKPPRVKKKDVLLFARPVPGHPGELQLVAPDAQLLWNPAEEAQLRSILIALVAADAPGRVTGVRELIHVPGTLAGEGETQIFLGTADGSAASITVQSKPGSPPLWGASFSELVAKLGDPPQPDTLAWYRLACFLPETPPPGVNHSETAAGRAKAEADYRLVLDRLGPCPRNRQ
jgi:hypothetical protein